MTKPRKLLVSTSDTPYYHCLSRCVRRAFLCGTDSVNGQSYEHRRQWVEERIRLLSSLFAIDICAYAVMSNHYHIVVKLNSSESWTDTDVLDRWLTLYKGPLLVQRYRQGEVLSAAEKTTVSDIIEVWRQRLQSLSWFMKSLNEPIARMANAEDHCSGHFWESRFKSQALLTEEALLTCMAYVDLNPIRAGMASTPETSDHTSLKERIQPRFSLAEAIKNQALPGNCNTSAKPLLAFEGRLTQRKPQPGLGFSLSDYLQLVGWTGRAIRNDKSGSIPTNLPPILARLHIPPHQWLGDSQHFEKIVHRRFRKSA
ncbi:transposase [Aestuariicella hydrocarbonica]|uniref:Transposase n=1 Tax=Pseudomaricurvus hydrocarbonicus TaxID=1470433 RepID=A0A9E5T2M0_9GAMM|nr:transposase [Aestuariicella hydrocarbonica]NHO68550.1 transposase [Aestuariicella hydrocarbonica]